MEDRSENKSLSSPKATHEAMDHRASRRNLLKLGAAGMPMVLTLKASARQVLISQLQCVITLPQRMRMLVDSDGNVWAGTRNISYESGLGGWNLADIAAFKEHGDTIYIENAAIPNSYIPASCPPSSGSSGKGKGKGKGDDDCDSDDDDDYDYDFDSDYDSASAEIEHLLSMPVIAEGDGMLLASRMKGDDDDDDDDCEEPTHIDCGYNYFKISNNAEISPSDYLNGCTWDYSGSKGLFVALSVDLSRRNVTSGWPGISCIASILAYLDQQC